MLKHHQQKLQIERVDLKKLHKKSYNELCILEEYLTNNIALLTFYELKKLILIRKYLSPIKKVKKNNLINFPNLMNEHNINKLPITISEIYFYNGENVENAWYFFDKIENLNNYLNKSDFRNALITIKFILKNFHKSIAGHIFNHNFIGAENSTYNILEITDEYNMNILQYCAIYNELGVLRGFLKYNNFGISNKSNNNKDHNYVTFLIENIYEWFDLSYFTKENKNIVLNIIQNKCFNSKYLEKQNLIAFLIDGNHLDLLNKIFKVLKNIDISYEELCNVSGKDLIEYCAEQNNFECFELLLNYFSDKSEFYNSPEKNIRTFSSAYVADSKEFCEKLYSKSEKHISENWRNRQENSMLLKIRPSSAAIK